MRLRRLIDFRLLAVTGAIALVLLVCLAGSAPAADSTAAAILGDADCSGGVDASDAVAMLQQQAGVQPVPCSASADVNCDGHLNVFDVLRLVRQIAQISDQTPTGCPAIGLPVDSSSSPTSANLIDDGLATGQISEATALEYKVFANFGDPRLPVRYSGSADLSRGVEIMGELSAQYNGLPQAEKDALAPYLLPPSAPGSWLEQLAAQPAASAADARVAAPCPPECPSFDWHTIIAAENHVKVWWQGNHPEDEAKAQFVADAFTNSIWDGLTAYMGREPLSDANEPNNGGDGLLDVYLVDMATLRGEVKTYLNQDDPTKPCQASPGWVLLDRTLSNDDLKVTAGHEFFHTIQDSYNTVDACYADEWLWEATATWSQDYLNPSDNREHERKHIFTYPEYSLFDRIDDRRYSAYVFFLYLTRGFDENLVREIWDATEHKPVLQAVDETIPGGFKTRWPEFSLYLWNEPPFDQLASWDGITDHAATRDEYSPHGRASVEVKLGDGHEQEIDPRSYVGPEKLTADYFHVILSDPKAISIRINDPFESDDKLGDAQALVKVEGEDWKLVNIREAGGASFCRTSPGENIQDLVIIVDNHGAGLTDYGSGYRNPLVVARDSCGWEGDTSGVSDFTTDGLTWSIAANAVGVRFEPAAAPADAAAKPEHFETTQDGSVAFTISGDYFRAASGVCTVTGTATFPIKRGDAYLDVTTTADQLSYSGFGDTSSGSNTVDIPIVIHCPDGDTPSNQVAGAWFFAGGKQTSSDPTRLEGSYDTSPIAGVSSHYEWTLTRSRPPQ